MKKKENRKEQLEKTWEKIWGVRDLEKTVNDLKKNRGKGLSDLYLRIHFPFVEKEIKKISSKARALEAGCGFGQWAFLIGEECQVVGIDIARKAIKTAQDYATKKKIKNCHFYCADLKAIPFKNDYFDYIFSFGVIEHFQDPSEVLSGFYRVLKPKGRVFISVPNIYSFHTITRPVTQALGLWKFGYERSYSIGSLKKLLNSFGFKILESGVMPGEELFGSWPNYIPIIGTVLYNVLRKVSLLIEKNQSRFSFWIYIIGQK